MSGEKPKEPLKGEALVSLRSLETVTWDLV